MVDAKAPPTPPSTAVEEPHTFSPPVPIRKKGKKASAALAAVRKKVHLVVHMNKQRRSDAEDEPGTQSNESEPPTPRDSEEDATVGALDEIAAPAELPATVSSVASVSTRTVEDARIPKKPVFETGVESSSESDRSRSRSSSSSDGGLRMGNSEPASAVAVTVPPVIRPPVEIKTPHSEHHLLGVSSSDDEEESKRDQLQLSASHSTTRGPPTNRSSTFGESVNSEDGYLRLLKSSMPKTTEEVGGSDGSDSEIEAIASHRSINAPMASATSISPAGSSRKDGSLPGSARSISPRRRTESPLTKSTSSVSNTKSASKKGGTKKKSSSGPNVADLLAELGLESSDGSDPGTVGGGGTTTSKQLSSARNRDASSSDDEFFN